MASEGGERLRLVSHHENPFFFGRSVGESCGDVGDTPLADFGRWRVSTSTFRVWSSTLTCPRISAVCGRSLGASSSKVVLRDGRAIRLAEGLAAPALMTEDMLPETECPRIVDMELSVSDEIVESGRMYSMRSENPTRARET